MRSRYFHLFSLFFYCFIFIIPFPKILNFKKTLENRCRSGLVTENWTGLRRFWDPSYVGFDRGSQCQWYVRFDLQAPWIVCRSSDAPAAPAGRARLATPYPDVRRRRAHTARHQLLHTFIWLRCLKTLSAPLLIDDSEMIFDCKCVVHMNITDYIFKELKQCTNKRLSIIWPEDNYNS